MTSVSGDEGGTDLSQDYAEAPATIPARMLNEFSYCPRLFYLEWVDGRWSSNDDTAVGDLVHFRNDSRRSRLGPPDMEGSGRASQVRLCDNGLGVNAIVDVVSHNEGVYLPIEMKKGSAPSGMDMWPSDRLQLLVQAVLLRRAGYRVDEMEMVYAGSNTRNRATVPKDAEEEVRLVVSRAREVAFSQQAPLPLINDRRCPRCSLVGLCLPDETNHALGRLNKPRRLMAPDPAAQPLYVVEQGARIGISQRLLEVTREGETLQKVRLIDVSQVCVVGNVQVSTQALHALWRHGAIVVWFSYGGWFSGWSQGPWGKHVELRRRQVLCHAQGSPIARRMIAAKIRNQRVMLRRNTKNGVDTDIQKQLKAAETTASESTGLAHLIGVEGAAARTYFGAFGDMMTPDSPFVEEFRSNGRARRPAPDPVNAVLGFCYGLLTKDIVASLVGVGLDPYLGILHRSRYGRPALALDVAEEFRPIVADSVCLSLVNTGELQEHHFLRGSAGVTLSSDGRRTVIRAYERRMNTTLRHPVFGYTISYRRTIDTQVRMLAAVMLGEIPEYTPITTR